MISGQPGLVPQLSGHLTRRRIQGATIYIDHHSDFIYVDLMESISGEETIQSKRAYERVAAAHGVHVKRCHSDNGRFGEKTFRLTCDEQGQKITFCGVGAHYQNGIAENRIKLLTLRSRTMLLYAKRYWPEYITTMLWPYELKMAEVYCNKFDVDEDGSSPEEKVLMFVQCKV
eukprot:5115122-Ditylum_brightwellii.AAC.1